MTGIEKELQDTDTNESVYYDAKIVVENGDAIKGFCNRLNEIPEFKILTPEQKIRIASCYPVITETVILE